jgi:hypothetical protein
MTVTGSGNFAYTRTLTGATNVTFPTTGTLSTLAGTETLTNKTLTGAAMNGTLGATTPSTVAATTLSTSGTLTANGGFNQGNAGAGARAAFSGNTLSGLAGANVEIGHDATTGAIISYNRTTSAYKALTVDGLSVNIQSSGSTIGAFSSTGLAVTGAITATGNITAYYSDDRLKTKLGNIKNALDKVCSLDGFYYEANETAQALGYKPVREVGLSAQSVQKVLPEVIAPAPIDPQYLTMHYERVVPLLVEAIKELRAEISALKKGNC